MKVDLNEIKVALSKATPGPWESTGTGIERDTREPLSRGYVRIANLYGNLDSNNPNHENDAHLIASAPEWLASLVSELELRIKYEGFLKSCVACGEPLEGTGYDKFETWKAKYQYLKGESHDPK